MLTELFMYLYEALHVWSCPALCLCVSSVLLAFWSPCLGKMELVFVLIMYLVLAMYTLIGVTFSLPPGVRGWLRLLLVALPGLFCLRKNWIVWGTLGCFDLSLCFRINSLCWGSRFFHVNYSKTSISTSFISFNFIQSNMNDICCFIISVVK